MNCLLSWWSAHWPDIKDFFNSTFFTSIIGATAGAFAGAYGAQRIAERNRYRDQLLKEIRDTNVATNLTFGICNALLNLKGQHVKRLKSAFDASRAALKEYRRKVDAGEIPRGAEFRFDADLETLSLPSLAAPVLQTQIFEKLSVTGRPLSLATTLVQTLHSLSATLEKRNELIASYKAGNPVLTAPLYFGLPQDGHINQDYPSCMDGIYRQTDDGIFFSYELNKELAKHGNQLAEHFKKRFGKGAPAITESDFSIAENAGLMPNPKDYSNWFTAFVKKGPDRDTPAA